MIKKVESGIYFAVYANAPKDKGGEEYKRVNGPFSPDGARRFLAIIGQIHDFQADIKKKAPLSLCGEGTDDFVSAILDSEVMRTIGVHIYCVDNEGKAFKCSYLDEAIEALEKRASSESGTPSGMTATPKKDNPEKGKCEKTLFRGRHKITLRYGCFATRTSSNWLRFKVYVSEDDTEALLKCTPWVVDEKRVQELLDAYWEEDCGFFLEISEQLVQFIVIVKENGGDNMQYTFDLTPSEKKELLELAYNWKTFWVDGKEATEFCRIGFDLMLLPKDITKYGESTVYTVDPADYATLKNLILRCRKKHNILSPTLDEDELEEELEYVLSRYTFDVIKEGNEISMVRRYLDYPPMKDDLLFGIDLTDEEKAALYKLTNEWDAEALKEKELITAEASSSADADDDATPEERKNWGNTLFRGGKHIILIYGGKSTLSSENWVRHQVYIHDELDAERILRSAPFKEEDIKDMVEAYATGMVDFCFSLETNGKDVQFVLRKVDDLGCMGAKHYFALTPEEKQTLLELANDWTAFWAIRPEAKEPERIGFDLRLLINSAAKLENGIVYTVGPTNCKGLSALIRRACKFSDDGDIGNSMLDYVLCDFGFDVAIKNGEVRMGIRNLDNAPSLDMFDTDTDFMEIELTEEEKATLIELADKWKACIDAETDGEWSDWYYCDAFRHRARATLVNRRK